MLCLTFYVNVASLYLVPWKLSAGWMEVGCEMNRDDSVPWEVGERGSGEAESDSEKVYSSHRRAVCKDPERADWLNWGGQESDSWLASFLPSPQAVPVDLSRRERALVGGRAPRGLGPACQHLAQDLSSGGETSRW